MTAINYVVDEARGAVVAHALSRRAERAARDRRNAAICELYRVGVEVPEIYRHLDGALSRSMIRWILGHS